MTVTQFRDLLYWPQRSSPREWLLDNLYREHL